MSAATYTYNQRFELESGAVLPQVEIAYHTYGKLSAKCDNIIWVCHALTGDSNVKEWWPNTVEEGKFLDPEKYFVVCANFLGSCYGSTGPLSVNPSTGEPYYKSFPKLTIRDLIKAHMLLADHLGITSVKALIGSSIGGFQVAEWIIMYPEFAKKAVIIASATKAHPWVIAFNESQRMAIECDSTFGEKRADAAAKGLATARSIAHLSYRCQKAYDLTQGESDDVWKTDDFRASSYQRYHGDKLVNRFNVYSYYSLTYLIDTHNIGRGRGSIAKALERVKADVAIVAISSDIIYPVCYHFEFHEHIKKSTFHIIESSFGHDGFLKEHQHLDNIIKEHIESI